MGNRIEQEQIPVNWKITISVGYTGGIEPADAGSHPHLSLILLSQARGAVHDSDPFLRTILRTPMEIGLLVDLNCPHNLGDRAVLTSQHFDLAQLGDNLFRFVMLLPHPILL
jgi:hypothetical protein